MKKIHRPGFQTDYCLGWADSLLSEGRRELASAQLAIAREFLKRRPLNRDERWDERYARYRSLSAQLEEPCACWFCAFSESDKSRVRELTLVKKAQLSARYPNERNNQIGALAEVVFGVRFGLPLNQTPGYDGGADFRVAGDPPLLIDVKATTVPIKRAGPVCWDFPSQVDWIERRNMVYVLLQIADFNHVFFRGFAFGSDSFESRLNARGEIIFGPRPARMLPELELLVDSCTARKTGNR